MKLDDYGQVILDEQDIITGIYSGQIASLKNLNIEDKQLVDQFNNSVETNADPLELAHAYVRPSLTLEQFDKHNQSQWFIPDSYKNFDIVNWLFDQCQTTEEKDRVAEELELFAQSQMIEVLQCLKYLVDFMRENKIVWGLGRGSSVSSYCLYLIGVHKINSLKYLLDIKEFLKGENNGQKDL